MTQALRGHEILAAVIREHYDLGAVKTPEQLPEAHQRRHRKLVCETEAGFFLVKTYKRDPHILDSLRFQHRLSEHLRANGLPVARIQPAKNGKRIVEIDTWALELQEFVQGYPMEVTSDTLAVSADALGGFHKACQDFPRPPRDARMWRFSEVPRETFGKFFEAARQGGEEGEVVKYCNEVALFLRDATKALSWEVRDTFETGLIHGDWHGGNLLFNGTKLVAIVDLEFAGDGCYLEDLSYGISNLCIRTTDVERRLEKRTNIVLDNYQRYRTLSYTEEVALYYAVGIKHVTTVSYQIAQMGGLLSGYTPAQWMERLAAQCAWLGQRAKAVRGG